MRIVRILLLWAIVCSPLAGPPPAWAEQQDEIQETVRVVEGLRQRRMFELAKQLVQTELSDPEIDPTQQVQLQLALIRTLVAEAVATPLAERPVLWQQVTQTIDDFRLANGDHPRQILIDVQQALAHQTRGNLLVQEIAAEMGGATEKDQALVELRNASREIKQVLAKVDRLIPEQRGRQLKDHELSVDQLLNLRRNMRFQEARTNLIKAQLYEPDDRLNRLDTLNLVSDRIDEVLNQSNPDQPLWWQAQINQAKCYTLLGNSAAADSLLRELPLKQLPASQASQLLEQKIEVAITSGQTDRMSRLLGEIQQANTTDPNLQLSILRLYMQLAKTAQDAPARGKWQQTAAGLTRSIETTNGPYWGRRAELVLIGPSGVVPPSTGNGSQPGMNTDASILIRMGDQAVRKNNLQDAARAYAKAASEAEQKGDGEQSLLASVRLSQVHEKTGDHEAAHDVLITSSLKHAGLPIASAAHLRGCWNWAQFAKQDPSRSAQFISLLQQNLTTWPDAVTADQARLWIAGYFQAESDWPKAITAYLAIQPQSVKAVEACRQLAYCYSRFRDTHKGKDPETGSLARQVIDHFTTNGEPPRIAILLLAEVGLTSGQLTSEQVTALLTPFIEQSGDKQLAAKQQAQAWRVAALALQGKTSDLARSALADLPNQPALLQLCGTALQRSEAFAAPGQQTNLAELKRILADKGLSAVNEPAARTYWQLEQARALQQLGQEDEAIKLLEQLAREKPKSQEIQLRLGRSLAQTAPGSEATLRQWRRIAAQVKPRSDAWFEAKLQVATALSAAGENGKALDMLNYMKAIPPGWQPSRWKAEFDQLLRQLKEQG
ncbi:MAG: hypothetical protein MK108_03290 [Mariniblastus sp.]|nr:hypothetical protein [Mariniblastus sp.]